MFFWKKKYTEPLDLSWLQTDLHSHLIPGIDDGAQEISDSIELITGMVQLGYKKLITTPHVLWEVYPNTTEIITRGLDGLKSAVKDAAIPVEIHAAAEYFMDEHFSDQLEKKVPLLPISGNMVLVEFSMITAPMDLKDMLFEMQLQNYQPLIAHPERYAYLTNRRAVYDELKDNGCLFQLNLLSLTGYYGSTVQELAEYLIKKNYYDFAGTDLHGTRHLAALQKLSASPLYQKIKEEGVLKNNSL